MTFINDDAGIKQFQLLKFVNENSNDECVMSKASIVFRRDKIEAPYYMISKIKISSCLDKPDNGIIHAMDILNHTRRHNLTQKTYNSIKSLIINASNDNLKSYQIKVSENEKQFNLILMSRNNEEFRNLFNNYHELFDKIDNLID